MKIDFIQLVDSNNKYIWKIYVKAMKPHITQIWGWDLDWQKNDFEKNLTKYETYILKADSKPMGYIQYKMNRDHTYINMIILNSEYQSKGYGEFIIKKILHQSHSHCLKLKCFRVNSSAFAFYKRLGFVVTQSDKDFISLKLSH